jgi:hypothetical protein
VERGVKVVGAVPGDEKDTTEAEAIEESSPPPPTKRRPGAPAPGPSRKAFGIVAVVAALGLAGSLVFGILYFTKSSAQVQDPAVLSASRTFLTDFFNFTPKTVDSDFDAITNMATGQFSGQAQQFFNSNIRKALETALASSRGSIRYLEVEHQGAGTAQIYAVVDQTYANNKISSVQSDVVRLLADLQQVNGVWKISNVTVLEGATPASTGSGSGSAGSSVPGQ